MLGYIILMRMQSFILGGWYDTGDIVQVMQMVSYIFLAE